jgi:prepilin-type N-terminal cleavage/methylation domain-containing protein
MRCPNVLMAVLGPNLGFGRNRRFARNHGFTLIEIVIAMGIGSLVTAGGTATVYQIFSNNARNTANMVAVKQVENALHFLQRDVQMAHTIQTSQTGADRITLTWVDWDTSETHTVRYTVTSSDKLVRTVDAGASETVAQYIAVLTPQAYTPGDPLTLTITSTVIGWQPSTETRTVQILPRS